MTGSPFFLKSWAVSNKNSFARWTSWSLLNHQVQRADFLASGTGCVCCEFSLRCYLFSTWWHSKLYFFWHLKKLIKATVTVLLCNQNRYFQGHRKQFISSRCQKLLQGLGLMTWITAHIDVNNHRQLLNAKSKRLKKQFLFFNFFLKLLMTDAWTKENPLCCLRVLCCLIKHAFEPSIGKQP